MLKHGQKQVRISTKLCLLCLVPFGASVKSLFSKLVVVIVSVLLSTILSSNLRFGPTDHRFMLDAWGDIIVGVAFEKLLIPQTLLVSKISLLLLLLFLFMLLYVGTKFVGGIAIAG